MSDNSIAKQLLINNLRMGMNADLTNLIKEYVFYDQVSQLTKYRKDGLLREIKLIKIGMTEGTTLLTDKEQFVHTRVRRWNYIRIWRRRPIPLVERPNPLLGFMTCSVCGNFYQTSKFLPITKEKIRVLPANLLRMVCCCSFTLTTEIQYSSITMSSYLRYDSEFDEDFSESSYSHGNNSDDSDNSEEEEDNEEIEYFYNNA